MITPLQVVINSRPQRKRLQKSTYIFLAGKCLDHFSENNNDDQQFTGILQLLAHAVPQTDPVSYIQQGPDTAAIISMQK